MCLCLLLSVHASDISRASCLDIAVGAALQVEICLPAVNFRLSTVGSPQQRQYHRPHRNAGLLRPALPAAARAVRTCVFWTCGPQHEGCGFMGGLSKQAFTCRGCCAGGPVSRPFLNAERTPPEGTSLLCRGLHVTPAHMLTTE